MHITELEDLQINALDKLPEIFGTRDLLEEELIAEAGARIGALTGGILIMIKSREEFDNERLARVLKQVLEWTTLCAYVMNIDCPLVEDLEEASEDWPDEVVQCGILATLMLQTKSSELTLDYFILDELDVGRMEELIEEIASVVMILGNRYNKSFREILRS